VSTVTGVEVALTTNLTPAANDNPNTTLAVDDFAVKMAELISSSMLKLISCCAIIVKESDHARVRVFDAIKV
jgi:hypothetical protein